MPLLALGAGSDCPLSRHGPILGVSASTFKVAAGIYLVIVAVMSSAIGGYLAARLRTKWIGVHTNEVFFRDTAHGFIAWAFAVADQCLACLAPPRHICWVAPPRWQARRRARRPPIPRKFMSTGFSGGMRQRPTGGFGAGAAAPAAPAAQRMSQWTARAEVLRLWTSSALQRWRPLGRRQDLCRAARCRPDRIEPGRCAKARR